MRKLKAAALTSLFLLGAAAAGVLYALSPGLSDENAYKELAGFSGARREVGTTRQERKGSLKSFLEGGSADRASLSVYCDTSTLYMKPSQGLGETVEEMRNVRAEWRKAVGGPPFYNLQADKAIFYPKLKHLTLEKASARQALEHQANSLEVVDAGTAIFDGELLHLSDGLHAVLKNMDVRADKGTFYPRKDQKQIEIDKIFLAGNVHVRSKPGQPPMDLQCARLSWDLLAKLLRADGSPGSPARCEDAAVVVEGDEFTAKLTDANGAMQAEKIDARGNIKLQTINNITSQYALADALEYTPADKTWILSAVSPRRVLYYDKANNVTISAPKILVQQREDKQKPYVKASGDVRFVFGEKELGELKQKFQSTSKSKP